MESSTPWPCDALESVSGFKGIVASLTNNPGEWARYCAAPETMPGDWNTKLDHVMRTLLASVLRPDRGIQLLTSIAPNPPEDAQNELPLVLSRFPVVCVIQDAPGSFAPDCMHISGCRGVLDGCLYSEKCSAGNLAKSWNQAKEMLGKGRVILLGGTLIDLASIWEHYTKSDSSAAGSQDISACGVVGPSGDFVDELSIVSKDGAPIGETSSNAGLFVFLDSSLIDPPPKALSCLKMAGKLAASQSPASATIRSRLLENFRIACSATDDKRAAFDFAWLYSTLTACDHTNIGNSSDLTIAAEHSATGSRFFLSDIALSGTTLQSRSLIASLAASLQLTGRVQEDCQRSSFVVPDSLDGLDVAVRKQWLTEFWDAQQGRDNHHQLHLLRQYGRERRRRHLLQ